MSNHPVFGSFTRLWVVWMVRNSKIRAQELLRFSLTDWEMLVEDAGLFDRIDREAVKMVFLQVRDE